MIKKGEKGWYARGIKMKTKMLEVQEVRDHKIKNSGGVYRDSAIVVN